MLCLLGLAAPAHDILALIKKFLCDNWFVGAFVSFAFVAYETEVKLILKDVLIPPNGQWLIVSARKSTSVQSGS